MEEEQWGRKIRAFRKLKGYTQADFSKKIGISLSLLGEIERENRQPDQQLIENICDTLNISAENMKRL
jgi:Predicted transcriptional regulators